MLLHHIQKQYEQLQHQISFLEEQIQSLPEGSLVCTRNGGYSKWYNREGPNLRYLKKKDRVLAEKLALKKYYTLQLQDYIREKNAMKRFLHSQKSTSRKAENLLLDTPEYRNLLSAHFTPSSQELADWAKMPYERNMQFPDKLLHKTLSGNIVRSKSEALIDMALYQNKIPYRYEASLHFNKLIIFPDFTLRHPITGDILYWEHFGMMDDPHYSRKAFSKLELYNANGLIPTIHVITTYETKEFPLTSKMIQETINSYLL